MRKILLVLALWLAPSLAFAQCTGVFPANTVCGSLAGGVPTAVAPAGFSSSGLVVGTSTITGGVNTRVLFDNSGVLGEYTNAQLTALINAVSGSASGAIPSFPNNTTTFFRGDGTYAGITCGALPALTGDATSSGCATTLATVNSNVGTFGSASQVGQFTVNAKGLITAASNVAIGLTSLSQLPTIANNTVLANNSGITAAPSALGPSLVLDMIGATQGNILYRAAGGWQVLAPGTSGQLLETQGAGANPQWITATGTGTVTSVANDGTIQSSVASNGAITTTGTLSLWGEPGSITNCILQASVAGNALTVTLATQAGGTPSAATPCTIAFRNVTPATGDYTYVKVTAATTFSTGATGSTFGATASNPFRLWVTAWNNAGTVVIGVSNQSTSSAVFPLNEGVIQSSTACSACTTATSAGVFYTTAAQTAKAIRTLGYLEWSSGLATPGVWASGPTNIQLNGPGIKKPGDVIQRAYVSAVANNETTASTTFVCSANVRVTLAPSSAVNLIRILASGTVANNTNNDSTFTQISRGTTANTNMVGAVSGTTVSASNANGAIAPMAVDSPDTTTSTTYCLQFRANAGTANLGGGFNMTMEAEEIQG